MTSAKVKWNWSDDMQESFENESSHMAKIKASHIPGCHKELEIQTQASKLQLELVYTTRSQASSLLLSQTKSAQTRYTVTKRILFP